MSTGITTGAGLLLMVLVACGVGRIPPHPAVVGSDHGWGGELDLALVGAVDSPPPVGLLGDVGTADDGVMLVGDAVRSPLPAAWERLGSRWAEVEVLPLRGRSELDVDPRGRRFDGLWTGAERWGRVDVAGHRLVWLDPTDPVDQRFWLPGAVARPAGGVVAVLAAPSSEVEQQLREATPASALALVVHGGAEGSRAWLPQGRWGTLEVDVGPVEGGVLEPVKGGDAFHGAQRAALTAELPASSWAMRPEATLRGALGPGGWWRLHVDEDAIVVEHRRRGNDGGWHASYRARWTRDGGWEESATR